MKRIYLFVFTFFILIKINAQICTHELPISFNSYEISKLNEQKGIDREIMPNLDMEAIEKEDIEDEEYDLPPRFGFSHKVDFNLNNSGTWHKLSNGDRLWQLRIICPNAFSINLLYDKFWIPEGGKFFVYTSDKKKTLGAFTSANNKGEKSDVQGFATGLLFGSEITLEYYQPSYVQDEAIISIAYVIHGYRYIHLGTKSLGESGSCQININCSDGNNWQDEKKAVAMIIINGNRICTGSLIRTTAINNEPLFLTANHCVSSYGDAVNSPTLNNWTFYWNYEAPGCNNISFEPNYTYTVGATILANNSNSDFALLRLTEDPRLICTPYYLGWDRSGNSGAGGVCIHHPSGDLKKISTYTITPYPSYYYNNNSNNSGNHWYVTWNGFGTTEPGSSGSALLNSNHHVIGQLHGGYSSCSNKLAPDWYGRFNVSWTGNSNYERLSNWLDPVGTGLTTFDGGYPTSLTGSSVVCSTEVFSIQNLPSGVTVQWSVSNSNLSLVSGQGTGTATFQKVSNGACTITAQVSIGTTTMTTITKEVWAGTPTAPTVTGWPHTNLFMENTEYDFVAHGNSQAQILEYQWTVVKGATLISGGSSSSASFMMNSPGPVSIKVRARNACGWGPYTNKSGSITDDNGLIPINSPGNNIVSIPLSGDGEYEIQLWNTNRMICSTKTTKSSYDVDLNNLPSDLYIIKVLRDGRSVSQLKVKK